MSYNTDLTDSQWQVITPLIDDQRKRKHSVREIVNAILYLTKSGCQWRLLPTEFPKWQLVYYYFRKWAANGLLSKLHARLRQQVRVKKGREPSPSLGLVDSRSVKTASLTPEKGFDGNKKINGRKHFVMTDTLGLIWGLVIVAADVGERTGAQLLCQELAGKMPRLEKILGDQGFEGEQFIRTIWENFGWVLEIVKKVLGVSGFQVLPKRWIVERTFGWLVFHRRLVKDYEEKVNHSEAFIQWAMIRLMVRTLAS